MPRCGTPWPVTVRMVMVVLGCTGLLPGCEFFRDEVERAERNCVQVAQPVDDGAVDDGAKHCQLVRSACEMDREGAACQALLERYR